VSGSPLVLASLLLGSPLLLSSPLVPRTPGCRIPPVLGASHRNDFGWFENILDQLPDGMDLPAVSCLLGLNHLLVGQTELSKCRQLPQ